MELLTPRQSEILEFICNFRDANGFSPTISEMAEHFGISGTSVHDHCNTLVDKGKLTRAAAFRARNFEPAGELYVSLTGVERAVEEAFGQGGRSAEIHKRLTSRLRHLSRHRQ